ncbi:hypothetical protein CWI38_0709p0040 [Hamiltosporidium tvaerminnensis]|uniref:Uncharacterized protein n=2 Tax=Hamiltosporidium TaxID=1176354 RepID=A0A4Q9L4D9_9MICR|nr:hypothetical protein LUQ84_002617 [Hamiltosporidium tvaerminnensis]TBU00538.1 hypothetical protein CWI36_1607p0010 [Hamiltosporidium magnivora]TBU01681.1 hypothetical protein CWI37_0653p0010 [Hamiltosporidium tvaerminnensis]TBU12567.1 hypothetical protein CWI38_0709p0040 [Hamiltosporidium tvaerminnensis]
MLIAYICLIRTLSTDVLNTPLNITLISSDQVLAAYEKQSIVFTEKEKFKNIDYDGLSSIEKNGNLYRLRFNKLFVCIDGNTKELSLCPSTSLYTKDFQIFRVGKCTVISSESKCLTVLKNEVFPFKNTFKGHFMSCIPNDKQQCFDFKHNMSDESIKSKNESDSNANEMSSDANSEQSSENNTYDDYTKGYNEKDSNRQKKPKQKSPKPFPNKLSSTLPKKKWDMDYVNKNLDDAHHLVAKTNPELDISTKRYYPECFYGYDNMTMFLNDVMPSLRKMKKKYCWHNMNQDSWHFS